jgi:hypothetical protein
MSEIRVDTISEKTSANGVAIDGVTLKDNKVTANGGLVADNITIDGTEIDLSSGDLTLDAAGRIDLSADDNGEVRLFDGSSNYGQFKDDSDRLKIQGLIADKDMLFVVNNGGSEATSIVIDSIGAVTKPLQPAFQVHPASSQTDIASGTTIAFGTERFDLGGNFASNTFTAPVTGKYQMNVLLRLEDIDTAYSYFRIYLNTSNKQYEWLMDPNFSADLDYLGVGFSILVDMDASDTSTVSWEHGSGSNQVDIAGASMWTGYLVC